MTTKLCIAMLYLTSSIIRSAVGTEPITFATFYSSEHSLVAGSAFVPSLTGSAIYRIVLYPPSRSLGSAVRQFANTLINRFSLKHRFSTASQNYLDSIATWQSLHKFIKRR